MKNLKPTFEWCLSDFIRRRRNKLLELVSYPFKQSIKYVQNIWLMCRLAFSHLKMWSLCSVHSKDLRFGNNHHQGSDFITFKFQGHVKGQRLKMLMSCRIFINLHSFKYIKISRNQKPTVKLSLFWYIFITGSCQSYCLILLKFDRYHFLEA